MHDDFDLRGKSAVVTGGSAGIGFAMARALARHGAEVAIWGRTRSKLDRAIASLRSEGFGVSALQVDISVEDAVIAGIAQTAERIGGLDVVIANAGVAIPMRRFTESRTDEYQRVMATNLDGTYWTLREAAAFMVARAKEGSPGGSIICVASLAAIEGAGHNQAYGASKGGVLALANGAAVELARYGIRVNSVLPGWIATDMMASSQVSTTFADRVLPRIPARRWGNPEDFAGVAVYLASDASSYQTGSTVVIDGGYSIF